MKTFHCDKCGQQVFFENVRCEHCGSMLGYQPELQEINAFAAVNETLWSSLHAANAGKLYKQCRNYAQEGICNWMLPVESPHELCPSCRLTTTIPPLNEQNRLYWQRLETAKRRLLYTLWELHLQPSPKWDDPQEGLAFEFLQDMPDLHVLTGHANGVITINIAEADPAYREQMREKLREPYRTLLGHFRHESGHYYFDRLIVPSTWMEPFRELFGDERQDYAAGLEKNYREGPPPHWEQYYISSYASCHPWEDWAETWAHYLHMIDTLDTAFSTGMMLRPRVPGEPELRMQAQPLNTAAFDDLMKEWFSLTYALNSLNRSVGTPDPYPFALSPVVMQKLRFVHDVILEHHRSRQMSEAAVQGDQGDSVIPV